MPIVGCERLRGKGVLSVGFEWAAAWDDAQDICEMFDVFSWWAPRGQMPDVGNAIAIAEEYGHCDVVTEIRRRIPEGRSGGTD